MWYIYVVKCADSSLYCGITKNVVDRIKKHNSGKGAKYTRSRLPVFLVDYAEVSESKSLALKAEIKFKRLSRAKKLELLEQGLCSLMHITQT